ncbi:helix-turn-helix domain-containing protein [Natronolimnohabitans innermongolicus]|uniref:Bacterio-opsin activator HTH domain-containing protein n=1 Tax=Natronolimnohabitans innermongolicus JCM 12255 TaxID=1227499 RepID=L9X1E7_9EURY|nr:helix-turn-helix domain-containing protein [Natronolimnohabitans innermongolicus]ELY55530.1 bacterio-opsin activator HTH domain-containing protein [Natronolimnohabitans innermongolicus JCM 12255]
MREFAFTIAYEPGADHVMDVFIDHPGLYARTVSCHATTDTMWRLDEVTGPPEALAAYDDCLEGIERCSSLRGMGGCPVDWTCETLAERPTSRLVYSRQSEGDGCRSVPYLAAIHLGDGVLCRAEQHGREYKWRILADDDAAIREIYDELEANLRDGLGLEFERLSEPTEWPTDRSGGSELPYKHREALELAVEYGYYDSPRRASVAEIADAEGIATSTLQYRLTQAESWLATSFVSSATAGPVTAAVGTTADD